MPTITITEDSPREVSSSVLSEHVFTPTTGPGLSDPLNLLEDPGAEEPDREVRAWFDGVSNEMTAGWSYSIDSPRSGGSSLLHDAATSGGATDKLYNRALIPVIEDTEFCFQAWIKASTAIIQKIRVGIEWQDIDQVTLGADSYVETAPSDGPEVYTALIGIATAPAGASFARFFVQSFNPTSGKYWYVDDCFLQQASAFAAQNLMMTSGMIRFGGTSQFFPALKKEGNDVAVRKADDSGYGNLRANVKLPDEFAGFITLKAPETVTNYDLVFPGSASGSPTTEFLRGDGSWAAPAGTYTDEQAQDAIGNNLGAGLSYNDTTGAISSTITQYTDEMAQDAIGAMVDSSLVYVDATPLLTRAALTGDVAAPQGSNATTLATVNSNVGSFGSATQVPQVTVNGKGLVTAATNVSIQIAESQVTNLVTDLAAKQPLDATLTSLALLGTAADKLAYTTGVDTWAETPLTAAGRALIDDANAAAQRATLGLAIGTDVEAHDATLTALAAYNTNGLLTQTAADTFTGRTITGTANKIVVTDGNGVSGNPTLNIGSDVVTLTDTQTLTNKTLTTPALTQPTQAGTRPVYELTYTGTTAKIRAGGLAANSAHFTLNATFDGTNFVQDDTGRASVLFNLNVITVGSESFNILSVPAGGSAATTHLRLLVGSGNLKLAGTALRATTEGTNHLDIFNGTAPVGTLANGISLYSTAGELRVMDAAGNATLLSPHDKETNAWIYQSKDINGRVLTIEVERLMRFLNDKFKLDCIHEEIEE